VYLIWKWFLDSGPFIWFSTVVFYVLLIIFHLCFPLLSFFYLYYIDFWRPHPRVACCLRLSRDYYLKLLCCGCWCYKFYEKCSCATGFCLNNALKTFITYKAVCCFEWNSISIVSLKLYKTMLCFVFSGKEWFVEKMCFSVSFKCFVCTWSMLFCVLFYIIIINVFHKQLISFLSIVVVNSWQKAQK